MAAKNETETEKEKKKKKKKSERKGRKRKKKIVLRTGRRPTLVVKYHSSVSYHMKFSPLGHLVPSWGQTGNDAQIYTYIQGVVTLGVGTMLQKQLHAVRPRTARHGLSTAEATPGRVRRGEHDQA